MRKLLLLLFCLFAFLSHAQQPFITTWEVTPSDLDITIPTNTADYTYDYTINLGDGTVLTNQTGNVTHTYATPGIYTVIISGAFPHFLGSLLSPNDANKLRSVQQWGDIIWLSMENMFNDCQNLVLNANDAPNLSSVVSLKRMFFDAELFNQSIDHWDVSNIEDMSGMFMFAKIFNQPLNSWNVSSVEDMSDMFYYNDFFSQPLNNWNVSKVKNMHRMFAKADSFNQPIGMWDVSSVNNMSSMFEDAASFNQNINEWNISNVLNMNSMFDGAELYNQPLNSWDVSNVNDMSEMFRNTEVFDQPLNSWNISNVNSVEGMFLNAEMFNQDLTNWDVSNVTNMNRMFRNADSFNQPLNNWDTSNVTDMYSMFNGCLSFNQPLNNWDTSNVTNMNRMFRNADSFNQPLDNWDTSNVTSMSSMFSGNDVFSQPLNNWDTSNVTNMSSMFRNTNSFNQPLDNWDTSNVTSMSSMFYGSLLFNQPLNNWDLSNLNSTGGMFANSEVFNQPLNDWNVSNVLYFDTSITEIGMFEGAVSFNQDLSSWNFSTQELINFVSNSNLSTVNYDLLMEKLVDLNLDTGILGAENIEYCDAFTRQQLINAGWTITDGGQADDCNLNYVSGQVLYDEMYDGCDANDNAVSNQLVNVNNGSGDVSFAIDENGQYIIPLETGNYTLSILNLNSNLTSTPATQTVNFSGENETIENIDFCITANQEFEDLSVDIFPLEDAIPGFETDYQIVVNNNGTQTVPNVQVTFAYDGDFQSFVSSTETPSGNTTNLLTFDLVDIAPFSQEVFEITLINFVPPTLNGGEILTFTAQVTPDVNDENAEDNTAIYDQTVVNSFDPNDKMVVQGEEIVDEDINQYLDYRIRFQNLGTANALNVKITDTISDKLDWTTFQPISSSHDYRVEIIDGEQINYYFDNINLPYEDLDEEGSNGYITYKIKPKSNVQIGDVIENTAYIYFDFNLPIVTNTATTTVVDELSVENFNLGEINVYPNPVENMLHLDWSSQLNVESISLYDLNGKLIKTFDNQKVLDVSQIENGIYILSVKTDKRSFHKKVIKGI